MPSAPMSNYNPSEDDVPDAEKGNDYIALNTISQSIEKPSSSSLVPSDTERSQRLSSDTKPVTTDLRKNETPQVLSVASLPGKR